MFEKSQTIPVEFITPPSSVTTEIQVVINDDKDKQILGDDMVNNSAEGRSTEPVEGGQSVKQLEQTKVIQLPPYDALKSSEFKYPSSLRAKYIRLSVNAETKIIIGSEDLTHTEILEYAGIDPKIGAIDAGYIDKKVIPEKGLVYILNSASATLDHAGFGAPMSKMSEEDAREVRRFTLRLLGKQFPNEQFDSEFVDQRSEDERMIGGASANA